MPLILFLLGGLGLFVLTRKTDYGQPFKGEGQLPPAPPPAPTLEEMQEHARRAEERPLDARIARPEPGSMWDLLTTVTPALPEAALPTMKRGFIEGHRLIGNAVQSLSIQNIAAGVGGPSRTQLRATMKYGATPGTILLGTHDGPGPDYTTNITASPVVAVY